MIDRTELVALREDLLRDDGPAVDDEVGAVATPHPLSIGGFDLGFRWLPASRYVPFGEDPVLHFKHMLLPALALALGPIAVYMRLLRTDMIATLQEDYINVAKAKGMGTMRILVGHALRPSSFTLLTVLGINIGALIGGSLIIEAIFTLPGLGSYIYTAVFQRDYIVIQGMVVVIAVGYVFANFAVDLLYAVLDPRVRHARAIA
ncbi:MAG: ABC transporter permease [Actinomycetota bacterium]|nr:ABC transporter permease [Actinomycetota bacterium]